MERQMGWRGWDVDFPRTQNGQGYEMGEKAQTFGNPLGTHGKLHKDGCAWQSFIVFGRQDGLVCHADGRQRVYSIHACVLDRKYGILCGLRLAGPLMERECGCVNRIGRIIRC
jgi:hypothetical protein